MSSKIKFEEFLSNRKAGKDKTLSDRRITLSDLWLAVQDLGMALLLQMLQTEWASHAERPICKSFASGLSSARLGTSRLTTRCVLETQSMPKSLHSSTFASVQDNFFCVLSHGEPNDMLGEAAKLGVLTVKTPLFVFREPIPIDEN